MERDRPIALTILAGLVTNKHKPLKQNKTSNTETRSNNQVVRRRTINVHKVKTVIGMLVAEWTNE